MKQLRILMQLRNFVLNNLPTIDSIVPYIKRELTLDYILGEYDGLEKGETKRATRLVKNLLRKTDFSIAKIADLVEVTPYFVKKIKKSMRRSAS